VAATAAADPPRLQENRWADVRSINVLAVGRTPRDTVSVGLALHVHAP
jgi:hypothetical protein